MDLLLFARSSLWGSHPIDALSVLEKLLIDCRDSPVHHWLVDQAHPNESDENCTLGIVQQGSQSLSPDCIRGDCTLGIALQGDQSPSLDCIRGDDGNLGRLHHGDQTYNCSRSHTVAWLREALIANDQFLHGAQIVRSLMCIKAIRPTCTCAAAGPCGWLSCATDRYTHVFAGSSLYVGPTLARLSCRGFATTLAVVEHLIVHKDLPPKAWHPSRLWHSARPKGMAEAQWLKHSSSSRSSGGISSELDMYQFGQLQQGIWQRSSNNVSDCEHSESNDN